MSTIRRQDLQWEQLRKLAPNEQFERVVRAINETSADILDAAQGWANVQTLPVSFRTGAAVADSFPMTVKLPKGSSDTPRAVMVARVENLTDSTPTWTDAVHAFWEKAGPGQILLRHISGLSASKQYTIHLLVLG
jgi:hypothetical protein